MSPHHVLRVICCACALVAGAAAAPAAAPAPAADIVDKSRLLYTADHQVTRLGVIFEEDKLEDKTVFFIESETDARGERVDYGLYALTRNVTTKLLDNARDIVVVNLQTAYFAARDGIYSYNREKNAAQKYGSVSEEVVSLAVENGTGVMYYLTGRRQLYRVTEAGSKVSIVDEVQGAEEVALDYAGHLYYYTAEHQFYVYDGRVARPVRGAPAGARRVWFVRTPVLAPDHGFVSADDQLYIIRAENASARALGGLRAGAASADAGFLVYFARERRIYEFNALALIVEGLSVALKKLGQGLRQYFNLV